MEYVEQMEEKLNTFTAIVKECLEAVQREQQHHYNKITRPWVLQLGDCVLLLLPNASCRPSQLSPKTDR